MKAMSLFAVFILSGTMGAHSQGTVQFLNSALSRVRFQQIPGGPLTTATDQFYAGLFWGTNSNQLRLSQPVTRMQGGIFNGGSAYPIPGTEPGQTVYMKLAAWDATGGTNGTGFNYWGEAGILPITLGSMEGPGTIIYQGLAGTNAYRFKPFTICGAWCYNNTPTWHFNSSQGARGPGRGGEVTFQMIRYDPYFRYPAMWLPFQTLDGTAIAGKDYVGTNASVYFPDGSMTQPVRIHLLPSDGTLGDRQFQIRPNPWLISPAIPAFEGVGTITDLSITALTPGPAGTSITFVTVPGRYYTVQSSEDLATWTPVPGLGSIPGGGTLSVLDPRPDCCGLRFYRVSNP